MKNNILLSLFLISLFCICIPTGAFLTEKIKITTASHLGYQGKFKKTVGDVLFRNNSMNNKFKKIKETYPENFREQASWKKLIQINNSDYTKIEGSGILFTHLISCSALFIFLYRRKKSISFSYPDWILTVLSLFYMKDVIFHLYYILIRGATPCDKLHFWNNLSLGYNQFYPIFIYLFLGIILFFYIFYKIEKPKRVIFFLSGFIGSILGFIIWYKYLNVFV